MLGWGKHVGLLTDYILNHRTYITDITGDFGLTTHDSQKDFRSDLNIWSFNLALAPLSFYYGVRYLTRVTRPGPHSMEP